MLQTVVKNRWAVLASHFGSTANLNQWQFRGRNDQNGHHYYRHAAKGLLILDEHGNQIDEAAALRVAVRLCV